MGLCKVGWWVGWCRVDGCVQGRLVGRWVWGGVGVQGRVVWGGWVCKVGWCGVDGCAR